MKNTIKATIYGDSIMNGTVMDQADNYIHIMDQNLRRFGAAFGIEANNRSHYGMTIEQGRKVLLYDLKKGLQSEYALIEFGGNDCNYRWKEVGERPEDDHKPRTPPELFVNVYVEMLAALKQQGIRPILMTLPPIDAEKYLAFLGRRGNDIRNILQWLGDVHMIYRFHESYSRAIEKIAQRTGDWIVDVRSYFLDKHNFRDLICSDGIHPNEEGHKLIFQAFRDFVAERLPEAALCAVIED